MDSVRRSIRNFLGSRSLAYRYLALAAESMAMIQIEGVAGYRALRRIANGGRASDQPVAFKSRRLLHPILVRPKTHDVNSIISTVIRADCGKFGPDVSPKTIIDAGAYIADSTVYFLCRYPESHVIAVEPDPDSAELARRNLEPYGDRARLVEAALTADGRDVFLTGHETGANVNSGNGTPVKSVNILDLLEMLPGGRVDLLKLDIEGVEEELFQSRAGDWLDRVGYLIVETHGEQITRNVTSVLNRLGWRYRRHRTQFYCTRTENGARGA